MVGIIDIHVRIRAGELERLRGSTTYDAGGPPGLSRLGVFIHRWRTRRQLLELNHEQLKDLGLDRADALGEGSKPFWRG